MQEIDNAVEKVVIDEEELGGIEIDHSVTYAIGKSVFSRSTI